MRRATLSFWLFFVATTLSGGLLGRYLAAILKGDITAGIVVTAFTTALIAAFSATVLLRLIHASTEAARGHGQAACHYVTIAKEVTP